MSRDLTQMTQLRREHGLCREEMIKLSDALVNSFAAVLQLEIRIYKRHIVSNEAIACHFRTVDTFGGGFFLDAQGVTLLELRHDETPRITAEVIVFSNGMRLGLSRHRGESYYRFRCVGKGGRDAWETFSVENGWMADGPDDWSTVEKPTDFSASNPIDDTWEE